MKRLVCVVLFSCLAPLLHAQQSYVNPDVVIRTFSTSSAAVSAMRSLPTAQRERAECGVVSTYSTSPYLAANSVSYILIVNPNQTDTDSCVTEGSAASVPEAWTGSDLCGGGTKSWFTESFTTIAARDTFFDTLTQLQQDNSHQWTAVGTQFLSKKYVLSYQTLGAHCF